MFEISQSEKYIIITLNSSMSIVILLVNAVVAFVIKTTKQLSNQSIVLTFVMCMIDIFHAMFGTTSLSLLVWFTNDIPHIQHIILDFMINLTIAAPATITLLVTVDRFIRIKYLNDYTSVFTAKRFRMSLIFMFVAIIMQACLGSLVTYRSDGDVNKGKGVVTAAGFCPILISCLIYYLSSMNLRKLQRERTNLSAETKNITKIASLYLILTVVFKAVPLLASAVLTPLRGDRSLLFIHLCSHNIASMYAIFNAVIFMSVNRQAKSYFQKFFTTRSSSATVGQQ